MNWAMSAPRPCAASRLPRWKRYWLRTRQVTIESGRAAKAARRLRLSAAVRAIVSFRVLTRQLGYGTPADMVDQYSQFYWERVSPYIQDAIRYLNVTASGRQWINGLYSNVFRAEHELRLWGPQP